MQRQPQPAKRGPVKRVVYSAVIRVSVTADFAHLVPFFQQWASLPRGRRNLALLTALERGAASAQETITQTESARVSRGIDAMLDAL